MNVPDSRIEAPSQRPRSRAPQSKKFWVIVLGAAVLYGVLNPEYQTGVFNDDAVYLMTARNLWSRDAFPIDSLTYSRPDFPFPGLPLVLAPLAKLVEPHWTWAEWLSVFVTTLSVLLLALLIRTELSERQTLIVLMLYALNPAVARYSGVLMPAPYLITAILGCLLLIRRILFRPSRIALLGLGVLLSWASLIRPEASLLLVTLPIAFLVHRRWSSAGAMLILPAMCWSIFLIERAHVMISTGSEYGGEVSALLSYWPQHLATFFSFSVELLNVYYGRVFCALTMTATAAHPWLMPTVTWIGSGLTVVGLGSVWKERRFDPGILIGMNFFSIGYFAVHVFWHVSTPRYGLILLPMVLVAVVVGTSRLCSLLPCSRAITSLLAVLFLSGYVYRDALSVRESLWRPDPLKISPEHTMQWVREHTQASDRLLSTVAPSVVLYAHRSAVNVLPASNEDEFFYLLLRDRLTYIVDRQVRGVNSAMDSTHDPNQVWDRIRRWVRLFPKRYVVVYENPFEKVTIYRVVADEAFARRYEEYLSAMNELKQGRMSQALTILHNLVKSDPAIGSAENTLGVLDYERRESLDEAESLLLRATDLLPDDTVAILNLASLYHLENRRDRCIACLLRGLQISTANGERAAFLKRVQALHESREMDVPEGFPTS